MCISKYTLPTLTHAYTLKGMRRHVCVSTRSDVFYFNLSHLFHLPNTQLIIYLIFLDYITYLSYIDTRFSIYFSKALQQQTFSQQYQASIRSYTNQYTNLIDELNYSRILYYLVILLKSSRTWNSSRRLCWCLYTKNSKDPKYFFRKIIFQV